MLTFKKITWKNFLSTGNVPNTIELNRYNSTLITGKNGEGKSTVLCALTFGLFGKPFRNVNKNQLINSINKKNCLVEIEFETNGREYIIKRGIKPNIFEIYCDGQLINQDAALKDYQKVLEQQILKLNYKTFTQVVILGSATFVPFMQLPAIQRRDVIEDILDIKVFSVMNTILKEQAAAVKDQITSIESQISNHKVKIAAQKKLIDTLESSRKNVIDALQQKIATNDQSIEKAESEIATINGEIASLSDAYTKQEQVSDAITKASKMKILVASNITTCQHDAEFFTNNETCPTCTQQIDAAYREKVLVELDAKIAKHQEKFNEVCAVMEKLNTKLQAANKVLDQIRTKTIEVSTHHNIINLLNKQNNDLHREIEHASLDTNNLNEEKMKMRQFAEDAIELVTKKSDLLDQRQLHEVASALLKDTGIKTAIIKEYLPVMNRLINKYLGAMDFFVKFELDESFQEVIKSRNRDAFTYDSFSEGEKRRLDLAILFTWRQIAKMKNSINTNIMILDEILDGALDAGGIDYFLSIMNQFGEHTNVFVISHKVDQMVDRFDNVIRVEKRNDFSVIT